MRRPIYEEIADLRDYIDGLPEELRSGPYGAVYRERLEEILHEAAEVELALIASTAPGPVMDLRVGKALGVIGRIRAYLLSEITGAWQTLYHALGQAAEGRPTSRGAIPADIIDRTNLDVIVFNEGSFSVRMVTDPSGQIETRGSELGVRAFHEFENLLAAGRDHHQLSVLLRRLRGRVLSSYTKLLNVQKAWDIDLNVLFCGPRSNLVTRQHIPSKVASETLETLEMVSSPEEGARETFPGVLNAANKRTGTFEIDLGEDGTMTGRAANPAVLEGLVIGHPHEFSVVEVVSKDPLTGTSGSTWLLEKATPTSEPTR